MNLKLFLEVGKSEIVNKSKRKKEVNAILTILNYYFFNKYFLILVLIFLSIIISEDIIKKKIGINKEEVTFNNNSFNITFMHNNENITFIIHVYCNEVLYISKLNVNEITNNIQIYDEYDNLIHPFDLSFYYDLHLFCSMKLINEIKEYETLPNIYNNTIFQCIEHFSLSDNVELGINIYQKESNYNLIFSCFYFSKSSKFLMFKIKNGNKFSMLNMENEYKNLQKEINKTKLTLKPSYFIKPSNNTKIKKYNEDIQWSFRNIYNHYFCFCKGIYCNNKDSSNRIYQRCKYYFYLSIIDKNRKLYNKTEYLFGDFIFSQYNSDDTFPIFKQMLKLNLPVHYMTSKTEIYKEYCQNNKSCKIIIFGKYINGDFLEKYIDLILRLKITVAGADFPSINDLFYNIEYITSINLGHGVKFFKSFLYKDYTSPKRYNKLVLAPSTKIISVAKKYGWKEENIIKNCLPKWDKYNNILNKNKFDKSIFIFFTFREIIKKKNKSQNNTLDMSQYYVNNILNLLNNTQLNHELKKYNISLYFGLHHNLKELKEYLTKNFKFVKIIENNLISDKLMSCNLMITDFSSVTFDFIYQRKPVIIYIPDYKDPKIKELYSDDYYNLVKSLGNGTIYFENKFFEINDVVNKIIEYIKSNFKLDKKLENFYNSFELNCTNNIATFINKLKIMK